jgi:hypothetical protein
MELNLTIQGICGNMAVVVHIGKLETVLTIEANELSNQAQMEIESIIYAHLQSIDTSELLAKLAN